MQYTSIFTASILIRRDKISNSVRQSFQSNRFPIVLFMDNTVQVEQELVAAADGLPDGQGSRQSPMVLAVALEKAFAMQAEGISVRLHLLGGIYRQKIRINGVRNAQVPITIEAANNAPAVLTGADDWSEPTDWIVSDGCWVHAWRPIAAPVPPPADFGDPWLRVPELMLRREMVIVGGQRLRQVLSSNELGPGAFWVDDEANLLTVHPPQGVEIGKTTIEVAVRHNLLELANVAHVTLRGLHFRHDAGACFANANSALRVTHGQHIHLIDCQASNNNHKGVQIDGDSNNICLERVVMNHNGSQGMLAARATNLKLNNCETSFNNWRGVWAGYYRRSPCGVKIWRSRDVLITDHRAFRNQATGVWIDEDNERISIQHSQVFGNRRGIHVEASDGPVNIIDCAVIGNRQEPLPNAFRWAFGSGIAITHSRSVTVSGCLLSGNDVAQIGVRDDRETRHIRLIADSTMREFRTENIRLQSNTITADFNGDWLRMPDSDFDGGRCLASLSSLDNHFISGGRTDAVAFVKRCYGMAVCKRLTLSQWQTLSGQDSDSIIDGSAN